MGNKISTHPQTNVFEQDLSKLNKVVNDIINDEDLFKNNHYNFLSQDVCKNFKIVLHEELSKHIKLDIKELGSSLYILPKDEDDEAPLTKHNLTKKQVCDKISNHYIKILYIICLAKYVYNTEKAGDLSIAGIVFRNIKIVNDMMQIVFCGLPHKDYTNKNNEPHKIDFSKLEGLSFFTKYFLPPDEANAFLGLLKAVLGRNSANQIAHHICKHNIKEFENTFKSRFPKSKITCQKGGLHMYVEKDNPVFQSDYCGAPLKLVVKLDTKEGAKVLALYKKMKTNYSRNVEDINCILHKLVVKVNDIYELKDIDKSTLNKLVDEVSDKVKLFYIQSIFDFQNLLDTAKNTPSIHIT